MCLERPEEKPFSTGSNPLVDRRCSIVEQKKTWCELAKLLVMQGDNRALRKYFHTLRFQLKRGIFIYIRSSSDVERFICRT